MLRFKGAKWFVIIMCRSINLQFVVLGLIVTWCIPAGTIIRDIHVAAQVNYLKCQNLTFPS